MSFSLNQDSIFTLVDGQICGSLTYSGAPGSASAMTSIIGQITGLFDTKSFYVANINDPPLIPVATARPTMGISANTLAITANGTSTATFSGVPSGVAVSIDSGTPTTITDGTLEFTATTAGTYTIAFTNFPMIPQTFEVVAS